MGITLISSSKFKVFLPSSFYSFQHNLLGVILLPRSLSPNPNFPLLFSFHTVLQEIAPGGAGEVRGHGLTLGSIDDVFVFCASQGFSVEVPSLNAVSVRHLGWETGHPATENSQSSNREFLLPPTDAQLVLADPSEQPLVVSFISLTQFHTLAAAANTPVCFDSSRRDTWHCLKKTHKVLVTRSQMCFWQMNNASCLQFWSAESRFSNKR